jgi:hypothetical protein
LRPCTAEVPRPSYGDRFLSTCISEVELSILSPEFPIMFFHVDESGHTGNNLFDANQPRLSYGLLSSKTNVDVLRARLHKEMLSRVGAPQLHANALGLDGLAKIAPLLCELQQKMRFEFDYYYIVKPDFAVTMLFEAIFDADLNEAVKWDAYWTPLRYLLLLKFNELLQNSGDGLLNSQHSGSQNSGPQ